MRIIFKGTVQGVGFRPAVHRAAVALGLSGSVWNEGSDVVVDVDEGERFLTSFLSSLPPLARLDEVVRVDAPAPRTQGFRISESVGGPSGMSIPTDVAVCGDCLDDMKKGRRSGYPFTSCTGCGPRFTLLGGLPYDRASTSMRGFGMCPDCQREYEGPGDRRFHHQTVCCPRCGPSYRLVGKDGLPVRGDPMAGFARMLSDGGIGVIKGWGGMHICCTLDNVARLREWYRRGQKPFAVMARDEAAVRRLGDPTEDEMECVLSPHRPIVLIKKRRSGVTDLVSPGLDNIGVFLPYTGAQHLVFWHLGGDSLVMTSANLPGEPMVLDDEGAMGLGADMLLTHDQAILNRADDSVLRVHGGRTSFIRRSRGHVPSHVPIGLEGSAVAVGAQENLAGAAACGGRIHPTQHIGDGDGVGVVEYLEEALRAHMGMLGCRPDAVAMDLHPGYSNRGLARRLAEEHGSELVEVQHHWAHAASLMVDNGADCVAALTLDGSGYGTDGTVWGGEVLAADLTGFSRAARLEGIPLLGSERALHDLRRLRFAIDAMNGEENRSFPDGEAAVLMKMMDKSVRCSSMGRLMDAVSYSLGVCSVRTYDGEPAMKLEPLLASGRLIPGFETESKGGVVGTAHLFSRIGDGGDPADVAYSIIYNVMRCLVEGAVDAADSAGMGPIGITGGVSYNSAVCRMFAELAEGSGHELIFHKDIPNGDGGVSVGQAAIALKMIQ